MNSFLLSRDRLHSSPFPLWTQTFFSDLHPTLHTSVFPVFQLHLQCAIAHALDSCSCSFLIWKTSLMKALWALDTHITWNLSWFFLVWTNFFVLLEHIICTCAWHECLLTYCRASYWPFPSLLIGGHTSFTIWILLALFSVPLYCSIAYI